MESPHMIILKTYQQQKQDRRRSQQINSRYSNNQQETVNMISQSKQTQYYPPFRRKPSQSTYQQSQYQSQGLQRQQLQTAAKSIGLSFDSRRNRKISSTCYQQQSQSQQHQQQLEQQQQYQSYCYPGYHLNPQDIQFPDSVASSRQSLCYSQSVIPVNEELDKSVPDIDNSNNNYNNINENNKQQQQQQHHDDTINLVDISQSIPQQQQSFTGITFNDNQKHESFLPQLLHELDLKKQQLKNQGKYAEANETKEQINHLVTLLEQQRVSESQTRYLEEQTELQKKGIEELKKLQDDWKNKIQAFEELCKLIEDQMHVNQQEEMEQLKGRLFGRLTLMKHKESPQMIELKKRAALLAKREEYMAALAVEQEADQAEKRWIQKQASERQSQIRCKLNQLSMKHQNELAAFKQRVEAGRVSQMNQQAKQENQLALRYYIANRDMLAVFALQKKKAASKQLVYNGSISSSNSNSVNSMYMKQFTSTNQTTKQVGESEEAELRIRSSSFINSQNYSNKERIRKVTGGCDVRC